MCVYVCVCCYNIMSLLNQYSEHYILLLVKTQYYYIPFLKIINLVIFAFYTEHEDFSILSHYVIKI